MIPLPILPPMQCDPGCGDCCTVVLCNEREYQAVRRLAKQRGITPKAQGLTCPFYQEGTCQVYEARPRVCRLFGHCERMVCSKGYNVNVPKSVEKAFTPNGYVPTRCLHETLGSQGMAEVKAILNGARA